MRGDPVAQALGGQLPLIRGLQPGPWHLSLVPRAEWGTRGAAGLWGEAALLGTEGPRSCPRMEGRTSCSLGALAGPVGTHTAPCC